MRKKSLKIMSKCVRKLKTIAFIVVRYLFVRKCL
jgi:hypothetical protein